MGRLKREREIRRREEIIENIVKSKKEKEKERGREREEEDRG